MFSYYPAASDVRVMSGLSRKAQNIDPESDEGDSRGCNKLINTDTWHYCCDAGHDLGDVCNVKCCYHGEERKLIESIRGPTDVIFQR